TVSLARSPSTVTVTQTGETLLPPALVPVIDGIGRHQHHLGHLVGGLAQMEQPKRNRPLPDFRFRCALDRLLDLAQIIGLEVKVNSFWHPSSISFFPDFRLLA